MQCNRCFQLESEIQSPLTLLQLLKEMQWAPLKRHQLPYLDNGLQKTI